MPLNLFDYHLPEESIACQPADPRDHARLMVIDRKKQQISQHIFKDLVDLLELSDVLVFNQTKVFPARLYGKKTSGGKVEILLLTQLSDANWEAISHPGLKIGQIINFENNLQAEVLEISGQVILKFNLAGEKLWQEINSQGLMPLPPYIKNNQPQDKLRQEYQTVYAKTVGSTAAPTAGLHFTKELLQKLQQKGVQLEYLTLHVGLGTFKPVTEDQINQGSLHHERYWLDQETAERLNLAKKEGRRIIAVGTTSTRTLESCAKNGRLKAGDGETNLFIYPPYKFKFVDGMVTNFHLPKSSLLMLVSALVSQPNSKEQFQDFNKTLVGKAYQEAIENKYRFYSFGDATLIV
jgi:S-adenosylmethionine:tRNA ribosyltransferase-isomerase